MLEPLPVRAGSPWLEWNVFAEVSDRAAAAPGGDQLPEALTRLSFDSPFHRPVRAVARQLVDPYRLYQLLRVAGHRQARCLDVTLEQRDSRELVMRFRHLRPTMRPNPVYFRVTAHIMEQLPVELLGVRPALVRLELRPDGADYHITPPRSPAWWRRIPAAVAVLFGGDDTAGLLDEQQREAQRLHARLQEAQRELTSALATRDAARREAEVKSRYLADMSHELRTPLNAIIGYAELLADELEAEGLADSLADVGRVQTAGRHLLELINAILDLSKIEAGRMKPNLVEVDLRDTCERVGVLLAQAAAARGNELRVTTPEAAALWRTDPTLLTQVLTNLVGNAVKFTEGGTVTVALEPLREGWSIEVSDTGVGISADGMARLFQPFQQATDTVRETHGGTGLGLVISRQLAQLLGGSIEVRSELGVGTTFKVVLGVGDEGEHDLEQWRHPGSGHVGG